MNNSLENLITSLPLFFIPEKAAGLSTTAQLELIDEKPDYWTLLIENQECKVIHQPAQNPQFELKAMPEDLLAILSGRLDITRAFMQGKIKFNGKIRQAFSLLEMFHIPDEYQSIF
jgi:putative sterol carrier protein